MFSDDEQIAGCVAKNTLSLSVHTERGISPKQASRYKVSGLI